ncbi:MAG: hypothetical protein NXI20_28155 [bacterium]|nr:hypothetical protein [bacterium]
MNDNQREVKLLPIHCKVESNDLPSVELINNWTKGDLSSKEIQTYLNWSKSDDEVVVYNGHVPIGLSLPLRFDFLIDLKDVKGGIAVEAVVKQSFWNGIIPENHIESGYKTITVIQFPQGVPTQLNSLLSIADSDFKMRFGLCNSDEKDQILANLKVHLR